MPELPARYQERWEAPFEARVLGALRPGMSILDVGAGRRPTIPPGTDQPTATTSALTSRRAELGPAPLGSYNETWVADVTQRVPELDGRFDLILTLQVLEHVRPLGARSTTSTSYLRPGGRFVGQFSGTFSYFGLANRSSPIG